MNEKIRLFIVDDHPLFRKGLVKLLQEEADFEVVGQAESGESAIKLSTQIKPQVILMDVNMPGGGGVEAVKAIKQSQETYIIMLTVSDKDHDLLHALNAGADGYLLKSAEPDELCRAIRQVFAGHGALAPELTTRVMRAAAHTPQVSYHLSARELEVLTHLSQGKTTLEIATALVISENTIKTHVSRILKKLNANNRTEAVAYAVQLGLVTPQ